MPYRAEKYLEIARILNFDYRPLDNDQKFNNEHLNNILEAFNLDKDCKHAHKRYKIAEQVGFRWDYAKSVNTVRGFNTYELDEIIEALKELEREKEAVQVE